jgi:hypothetical protein
MVLTRSGRKALRTGDPDKKFVELDAHGDPPKKTTVFSRFKSWENSNPVVFNVVLSAIIAAASTVAKAQITGDFSGIEGELKKWVAFAVFVTTPISMVWYKWMGKQNFSPFKAIIVDQAVFMPVFNAAFVAFLAGWETRTLPTADAFTPFTGFFWKVLINGWMFWAPWAVVRTYSIPPYAFIVFNSFGGFIYGIILQMFVV